MMRKAKTLRSKISFAMITMLIALLLCVGIIIAFSMMDVSDTLIESNRQMGETSSQQSSISLSEMTKTRLLELADNKATIADGFFRSFQYAIETAAFDAEQICSHPEHYNPCPVALPSASNEGKVTAQVLYAPGVDPQNAKIQAELLLLGNVQDTLLAINESITGITSNYIATESGIVIVADRISAEKLDEGGTPLPFDARQRPWYKGAVSTGGFYVTSITQDAHTERQCIMCSVPIMVNGKLIGVSGTGIYLDTISSLVRSVYLGRSGDACILNQEGQILFSTDDQGTLAAISIDTELHVCENEQLVRLAAKGSMGEKGVELVEIDGQLCYVAYAPMETVAWSFFIILPKEEVETPTRQMEETLGLIEAHAVKTAHRRLNRAIMMLLVLSISALAISLVVSLILSRRIVRPIQQLADKVSRVEGDHLDFEWDQDTGDETQLLATSFQSLTERMNTYIHDIQTITSEKQRIDTELALATRIQASMLPHDFPPFPDRKDFDIYATMNPAKEVGGDFYDFFMTDDDHLALVIADVSGKGVPAALFMMASKIIIRNAAMTHSKPSEVLSITNISLCANNPEQMFVTIWLGMLELSTGRLTAASAGHEYPVLTGPDGHLALFRDKHGMVAGGIQGVKYTDYELQLKPGSCLFVYTDGLPEATNSSVEMFGANRMIEALRSAEDGTPEEILACVNRAVQDFVGTAEQFDDLTMLCLKYRGPDGAGSASPESGETA